MQQTTCLQLWPHAVLPHPRGWKCSQVNDAAARQQVADLQRDNGILKRAVAIQNARLQVRAVLHNDGQAVSTTP